MSEPQLLAYVEISNDGDLVRGRGALAFTNTSGPGLTNLSMLLPGYPIGTDPDTLNPLFINNMKGTRM